MSADLKIEELGKESQDLLRFLLHDHAFSEEFLVTTIQEYYDNNKPKEEASDSMPSQKQTSER